MNKKQGIIIVSLLVLIVLAGVMATKLNSGNELYVGNDSGKSTISSSLSEKNSKAEYFAEAKTSRDQANATAIQNYKNMIDDKNVSDASRKEAEKKYLGLTDNCKNEQKIEMELKGKGYDDSICSIQDDTARIILKAKELTNDQRREIKDVVMNVAKISKVTIEATQ